MNISVLSRTDLKILGLLAPGAFLLASAFVVSLTRDRNDHSGMFVLVLLTLGTSLAAGILSLGAFDRFWKVHLFACLGSVIPAALLFLIATLAALASGGGGMGGIGGGILLLAVICLFFITISSISALPITGIAYAALRSVRERRETRASPLS